jgi:hypothetical protein
MELGGDGVGVGDGPKDAHGTGAPGKTATSMWNTRARRVIQDSRLGEWSTRFSSSLGLWDAATSCLSLVGNSESCLGGGGWVDIWGTMRWRSACREARAP